jgi:hypothetical protein
MLQKNIPLASISNLFYNKNILMRKQVFNTDLVKFLSIQGYTSVGSSISSKCVGTPYQNQCSGSMTFWCGSGSTDLCLWLINPDPDADPAIFVIDLQEANKKQIFNTVFLLITFWKYINNIFQS